MPIPTVVITGKLAEIFPAEQITDRFTKRCFWLEEETGEARPNTWECELQNADCSDIDKYNLHDRLEVTVEVRGRRYTGKGNERIFHTLKVVGIRRTTAAGLKQFPEQGATPRPTHFTRRFTHRP